MHSSVCKKVAAPDMEQSPLCTSVFAEEIEQKSDFVCTAQICSYCLVLTKQIKIFISALMLGNLKKSQKWKNVIHFNYEQTWCSSIDSFVIK